jgi:hypothetical protein
MDLITELENEFSALSEQIAPGTVVIRTGLHELELKLPQLGDDYVAGLSQGSVVIIPKRNIIEIRGAALPIRRQNTLEQFLGNQRTPVRVQLRTGEQIEQCWLLNIGEGWLRVAISRGISWVPIEAIQSLEIVAVDNSIR